MSRVQRKINHTGGTSGGRIAVRSAGGTYMAAAVAALFFAAVLVRFNFERLSLTWLAFSWLGLAFLALTDRIVVERRRITRAGFVGRLFRLVTGRGVRLKFADIEQIETYSIERIKRGGTVFYTYKTIVRGGSCEFVFRSNRRSYGRVIAQLFANVPEDVMDNRSLELRDYFSDRRSVRSRLRVSEIPRGEVLEASWQKIRPGRLKIREVGKAESDGDPIRAERLRRLANELRLAGFLVQALEAFRRAALLQPRNSWLLFEFGRCILSCAASERDERLERRGLAMLRLAEQRAGRDAQLLSRLGESFFHAGDWRRASRTFRKATESIGSSFRAERGQAEIALREGKFARVVHYFSTANSLSPGRALRRWTNSEIEYFTRLSDDDAYAELEISRLGLADSFDRLCRSMALLWGVGLLVILTGTLTGEAAAADVGWTIAVISAAVSIIARVGGGVLASRIPLDTLDK